MMVRGAQLKLMPMETMLEIKASGVTVIQARVQFHQTQMVNRIRKGIFPSSKKPTWNIIREIVC